MSFWKEEYRTTISIIAVEQVNLGKKLLLEHVVAKNEKGGNKVLPSCLKVSLHQHNLK
jgi:hypothetical protein